LIDLASFLLGFMAFVGAIFASYNARNQLLEAIDRLAIKSAVTDISFDTTVESFKICERVKHTPYKPPAIRKTECDRLNRYIGNLSFDPATPFPLRVPNWENYTDPETRKLAERTFSRVDGVNVQIEAFLRDLKTNSTAGALENLFREISLPILAFAFGLGVARRSIDLYLVLPPRLKMPVDKWLAFLRRLLRRGYRRLRTSLTRASSVTTGAP
jgi:hypothetical protein